MNMYNADISRHCDFRELRKVLQIEPNTNMNVYNANLSHQNHDFGEHFPMMLEPNTDSDMNDVYTDLSYQRDIVEQRREMQEAKTLSDMNVHAHLCRHRNLDEQLRKMPKPSDCLNKALDAINTIVDYVAVVAEEEDNANMNMNMNMNAASTTTNDNSPSNNHNPMYHDFRSSSPLLLSPSIDFQQHLHQLQKQQQMKHELDQLQKRQQELVQMMSTNTTTMTQKCNSPYVPMAMPMSQIQQEKEQQQQLQSSTAMASATITPPITKKKKVNLGKTHFTIDLTEEEEEPTRTTVDNNNTGPSELDILLGRGRGAEKHQGNICYRKVVESFRKQYEAIKHKRDKTRFIRDVVDIFYDTGHRFVKKVEDSNPNGCATSACTGAWVPVDRHVARDKVSNSFRNSKRLQMATTSASASANNKW